MVGIRTRGHGSEWLFCCALCLLLPRTNRLNAARWLRPCSQDYGYWYSDKNRLYPNLASCSVAMDPCTLDNGCLQVLKGSNRLGRLDHVAVDGQTNADPARVALVEATHDRVACTMSPGDALFFHCNTLHSSAPNSSPQPRWALVSCFCCRNNTGAQDVDFMEAWDDKSVLECGREQLAKFQRERAKM